MESQRAEMLRVNKRQARLYDEEATAWSTDSSPPERPAPMKDNLAARLWTRLKQRRHLIEEEIGLRGIKDELHAQWMEDPSSKRILDLGCLTGCEFILERARQARYYLGVDLSEKAIEVLCHRLEENGVEHGETLAMDFLSPDFPEGDFDIVHARSVIHHFRHFEVFLRILHERMAPGGIVLTFDPLQTAPVARLVRSLYRPFQKDKEWEWPLTRESFEQIQKYFVIEEVQGLLGRAKWSLPLSLVNRDLAIQWGRRWHQHDLRAASEVGSGLWPCLHVAMKWRRR